MNVHFFYVISLNILILICERLPVYFVIFFIVSTNIEGKVSWLWMFFVRGY